MSSSDPDGAWNNFYQEYGKAMVAWQLMESELATLFSMLSRIPPDMAIQIFYSARSFSGRMDILKASLTVSKAPKEDLTFTRSIVKKAKQYSEFRNKLAHDQPLLRQWGQPAQFEVLIVDGKGQFQNAFLKQKYIEDAVTLTNITATADAFRTFAKLIQDFWADKTTRTASLDKLRERLQALPTLPPSKDQSPPSGEPAPPPSPSGE